MVIVTLFSLITVLTHPLIRQLTHSPTHSLRLTPLSLTLTTHPLHSLTHTHSLTHLLTHPPTHPLSLTHTHSPIHSFTHPPTQCSLSILSQCFLPPLRHAFLLAFVPSGFWPRLMSRLLSDRSIFRLAQKGCGLTDRGMYAPSLVRASYIKIMGKKCAHEKTDVVILANYGSSLV